MFSMSVPWWEIILRAVITYLCLIPLLRAAGRRQIGQLTPYDFVPILVLSNTVQNSLIADDRSVQGGLLSAVVIVGMNTLIAKITYWSRRAERIIEGEPLVLIRHGKVNHALLKQENLSYRELKAALRAEGYVGISKIGAAILENNGRISVRSREEEE